MNSAQRNYIKKQIEELKVNNWSLTSGMVLWVILGVVTLVTIVGPYLCYGYVRKYRLKKKENLARIEELERKITKAS